MSASCGGEKGRVEECARCACGRIQQVQNAYFWKQKKQRQWSGIQANTHEENGDGKRSN